jgi:hypothetical protein
LIACVLDPLKAPQSPRPTSLNLSILASPLEAVLSPSQGRMNDATLQPGLITNGHVN